MKNLLLTTIAALLLVGCGPSVDIHQAAEEGNIEAVKQHLADGADVNAKNRSGATAMHSTPLCEAAGGGHKEVAELLIERGADVNAWDKRGKTPLHNAAWKGHVEIAKLLITKGADVNAKADKGRTPLDWAEKVNDRHSYKGKADKKEIADLLRKHGGKTGEELKAEGK